MSLNFHKIDTNSQKFYPENLVFQDKGFYLKFFYHKSLEPYGMAQRISYFGITDSCLDSNCLYCEKNWTDTPNIIAGQKVGRLKYFSVSFLKFDTVQLRCNFTLASEHFIHTLEQFTRARIELFVACALFPTRNSRKVIR